MKDSQHYSKIAKKYLEDLSRKDNIKYNMVCYGNLTDMEELFDLFGGDRNYKYQERINKGWMPGNFVHWRFTFVMNKLDRESKKSGALFKKGYICYNGIINRPTRCFTLKED